MNFLPAMAAESRCLRQYRRQWGVESGARVVRPPAQPGGMRGDVAAQTEAAAVALRTRADSGEFRPTAQWSRLTAHHRRCRGARAAACVAVCPRCCSHEVPLWWCARARAARRARCSVAPMDRQMLEA